MNVFYEERLSCGVSNPFGVEVVNIRLTPEFRKALMVGSSARFDCWSYGMPLPQPEMREGIIYSMKDLFNDVFIDQKVEVDLGSWDFSKVVNTSYMFAHCTKLVNVRLPSKGFDNIWNVERMFWGCTDLKKFDWEYASLPNVHYIRGMFQGCNNLKIARLPKMSGIVSACDMFEGCRNLKEVNLDVMIMDMCISVANMFRDCTSMTEITLPYWNCKSLETMEGLFSGCLNLRGAYIDPLSVSGPLDQLTNLRDMFTGCSSLELVYLPQITGKLIDISSIFRGCTHLTKVNINNLNLNFVRNFNKMFADCIRLENVIFPGFKLQNLAFVDYMFKDCGAMREFPKGLPLFIASNYKATIGCHDEFTVSFRDRFIVVDESDISLMRSVVADTTMYFDLYGMCNSFIKLEDSQFEQHTQCILDNSGMTHMFSLEKTIVHLSGLDGIIEYCQGRCADLTNLGIAPTVEKHNRLCDMGDRIPQRLLVVDKPFSCGDVDTVEKLSRLLRICRSAGVIPVIVDTIDCPEKLKPHIRVMYDLSVKQSKR